MPYVPGFDYDLFISYATHDNDGDAVVEFVETLEKHLSDNLVNFASPKEKVKVYFDRNRLAKKTSVNWLQELEAAASSCALLVPLLSPNYLSSEYCTKERGWFCSQTHARDAPLAVIGWRKIVGTHLPPELENPERHPPGDAWLADRSPAERRVSAREFALKLRDVLLEKRGSVSAVFLGPAAGRTAALKEYLRDELERAGYRVVPEAEYLYEDDHKVPELLKSALLAVHFLGDGNAEAIPVMDKSLQSLPYKKTVLIKPAGVELSPDEADFLEESAEREHTYLRDKTNPQVWEFIRRDVRAARFRADPQRERVGVACHELDLQGAKDVAGVIRGAGISVHWPRFDMARSTTEKLKAFRDTVTESDSLLYYWAKAEERHLVERLRPASRRKYKALGWYLAPPLDMPGKDAVEGLVMRQERENADVATLGKFLDKLGWRPD